MFFGHGNEEEVHAPFVSSNTPRTRACKLFGVQGKVNKKEWKIKEENWMQVPLQLSMS
jgi:hypothetical protein